MQRLQLRQLEGSSSKMHAQQEHCPFSQLPTCFSLQVYFRLRQRPTRTMLLAPSARGSRLVAEYTYHKRASSDFLHKVLGRCLRRCSESRVSALLHHVAELCLSMASAPKQSCGNVQRECRSNHLARDSACRKPGSRM